MNTRDTPDTVTPASVSPDTTPRSDTGDTAPHTAPTTSFGSPPMLSQAEAARRCGVSTATIRRARSDGRLPGAVETVEGWRIPIPELIAAGLMDRTTPPDAGAALSVSPGATPPSDMGATPPILAAEVAELRAQLAEAQRRAELAEERERSARALAVEKERALDDARAWRRMIEAGPAPAVHVSQPKPTPAATQPAPSVVEPAAQPDPAPTQPDPQPAAVVEDRQPPHTTASEGLHIAQPERARSRFARWFSGR